MVLSLCSPQMQQKLFHCGSSIFLLASQSSKYIKKGSQSLRNYHTPQEEAVKTLFPRLRFYLLNILIATAIKSESDGKEDKTTMTEIWSRGQKGLPWPPHVQADPWRDHVLLSQQPCLTTHECLHGRS